MQNIKLLTILSDIGMNENEAKVYLAALSLGPTTILKIARSTEIKRSTVYSVIESLKLKGLIKIEIRGLKSLFVAENPERLEIMLENRKYEFKNNLPEFLALYNLKSTESTIKYYEGIESLKNIYMETLREINPHEEYLVIANQDQWYHLDPKFAQEYIERRAKLRITTKLLFQDSFVAQEHKKFERNYNELVKILPIGTSLQIDTIILPRKIIITQTIAPISVIVIENQSVVQLQKTLFDLVWNSLDK